MGCGTPLVYYMGIEEKRKMAKDFVKRMVPTKRRAEENGTDTHKDVAEQQNEA